MRDCIFLLLQCCSTGGPWATCSSQGSTAACTAHTARDLGQSTCCQCCLGGKMGAGLCTDNTTQEKVEKLCATGTAQEKGDPLPQHTVCGVCGLRTTRQCHVQPPDIQRLDSPVLVIQSLHSYVLFQHSLYV